MATQVPLEETKSTKPEKSNKMQKCYHYMSKLKKLLTKDEYAQFLVYLRMLKDNYMREKISFYAMVSFQIFFPSEMKDVISNYEIRKSLFFQSKYFFPKADREEYNQACSNLVFKINKEVNSYLVTQSCKPQKEDYDVCAKIQSPEFAQWQRLPLKERIKVDSETTRGVSEAGVLECQKRPESEKSSEGNPICMICFEDWENGKEFAKAKCGHVACWTCWTQWLDNCLECPMCKQRTRLKQLVKLL